MKKTPKASQLLAFDTLFNEEKDVILIAKTGYIEKAWYSTLHQFGAQIFLSTLTSCRMDISKTLHLRISKRFYFPQFSLCSGGVSVLANAQLHIYSILKFVASASRVL